MMFIFFELLRKITLSFYKHKYCRYNRHQDYKPSVMFIRELFNNPYSRYCANQNKWQHHEIQYQYLLLNRIPHKNMKRKFKKIDYQKKPGSRSDINILRQSYRQQIDCHNAVSKISNHGSESRSHTHRISKRFLDKLHELFSNGINGQDEIIYGSVCIKYNFSYNYKILSSMIKGIWSADINDARRNYTIY